LVACGMFFRTHKAHTKELIADMAYKCLASLNTTQDFGF
jgi:hypothetical protein